MLEKHMRVLNSMYRRTIFLGDPVTIGELERSTKIPYSTIRRLLLKAEEMGKVASEIRPYKSTGKRVFALTESGLQWVEGNRELIES